MGISGLLPLLRPITTTVHLRDLAGQRVGVDGYVWLHRGTYGCAPDLCQGRPTKRYLNHCIERLNALLHAGAHVYLVFDGGPLPAKKGTEGERRARREESKRRALQCLAEGKAGEAFQHFTKAVDVSPAMAREWIRTVQGVPNVSYVVAPYEADAQLAFLCRAGLIDAVITEDSDVVAFGAPRVLFKLDQDGSAQQILHADLFKAPIEGLGDLRAWDEETFLHMCILSGCDYLPSVHGMGLRSACRLLQRHRTPDKALRALRLQQYGKGRAAVQVPRDYEARFREAFLTFRHQRVFDPRTREMAHVHPLPPDLAVLPPAELEFLGPPLEAEVAAGIADGELDPITLEPFPSPSEIDAVVPGPTVAVAAARAAAQPRISAYLQKLPSRPPAPVRAPEGENEEEKEEQEQEKENEAAGGARPIPIYQPGLRKSAVPVRSSSLQQQQEGSSSSKGVGSYLRRTAAAIADATANATANLLQRKRPVPTGAAASSELDTASTGCLPLPQVSSWFGSKASHGGADKENSMPAPAPAPIPVRRSSSSAYALSSSKRPRTLGASARPTSFGLRGFAGRGWREEEEEEEGGGGEQEAAGELSEDGGGYEDSLQPPTPGTPFVAPPQPPRRASLPSIPPPDEEGEQRSVEMRVVSSTSSSIITSTASSSATVTTSSIFEEFSFEPPQQQQEKEKEKEEGTQVRKGGGGGRGGAPLAALAPNTMTPSAHHAQRQRQRQQQQPRASVVAAEGGSHSTPAAGPKRVSASVASFSFEAFEFTATDADAGLLSSSSSYFS